MTRTEWELNIENLVTRVTEKYGAATAKGAFQRFGATCLDDLPTYYYDEVFGYLMQIDAD